MFPDDARKVRAMLEEAAMSRLYAGIHDRFDNEAGMRMGRAVRHWQRRRLELGKGLTAKFRRCLNEAKRKK